MSFGVCRLQLRPAADRKSQICEVKAWIWLKKDHTLISGVEEDSFTSPLLFSRYNHKITKYCWEEKRAHQRVTKWKMKVWKCQIQARSFLSQETNYWLSPGDDDWLQKQISAVVTFCTPAELEHSDWDDEFNLCCTPTVYSAVGARAPCAVCNHTDCYWEWERVGEEKRSRWRAGYENKVKNTASENKRLHFLFLCECVWRMRRGHSRDLKGTIRVASSAGEGKLHPSNFGLFACLSAAWTK